MSAVVPESPRRGRPRDPSRDRALLQAAREVIAERGVTGASMEDIARTAGTGKDTLYRRWSSKEALAVAVIDTVAAESVRPAAVDPDPRVNLMLFLKDIVRLNRTTDFGRLVAGVVGASSRDPSVASSFQAFWARRREIAAGLVRDVVGGEIRDDELATALDHLLGPIYYRLLLTGEEITDAYLWDLVDQLRWTTGADPDFPQPPGPARRPR